jgi:hypothetical protein
MAYPTKIQWLIIWATFLVAAHLWLPGNLDQILPRSDDTQWGIPGYLSQTADTPSHLPIIVLAAGVLLCWQASRWHRSPPPPPPAK